jgi:hypothetical protein
LYMYGGGGQETALLSMDCAVLNQLLQVGRSSLSMSTLKYHIVDGAPLGQVPRSPPTQPHQFPKPTLLESTIPLFVYAVQDESEPECLGNYNNTLGGVSDQIGCTEYSVRGITSS